jgi:LysR family glycine cleavage system transcriptional activator
MKRRIPSLSALQAFESAARHLSFTRAAEELNLTQSAISRHVRELEEQFGLRLFRRFKQSITLTKAGETYVAEIRPSLARIETSTLHILTYRRGAATFNLATVPTFGTKWLVPRLQSFHRENPGVVINFILRPDPFEFTGSNIDAAISFGLPKSAGIVANYLIGEELIPVCSPRLLADSAIPLMPQDFERYPLLQLRGSDVWDNWFNSFGLVRPASTPASRFDHFTMGIQAAICGMGILLVPHFLVIDDIREGRLVVPNWGVIKTGTAYYFTYPETKKNLRAINVFRDWISACINLTSQECQALNTTLADF